MSDNKMSGYDVPTTITLDLPNYWDRAALASAWYGEPSKFNPSVAFSSLVSKANSADTMKKVYSKEITASVLIGSVVRNFDESAHITSDWATGDSEEFDAWLADFEADRDFVKKFIDMNGDADEQNNCTPGGGSYGFDAYRYGAIVVATDTEGGAWYFPSGTECGPDVEDYEENSDEE